MQTSNEQKERKKKLQVLNGKIGAFHRRDIKKHQDNPSERENKEKSRGDGSKPTRIAPCQAIPGDLGWEPVQQEIANNRISGFAFARRLPGPFHFLPGILFRWH